MPNSSPQRLQFKLILGQDFIGAFCFFAPQALLITYLHEHLMLPPAVMSIVLFLLLFFSRIGRLFLIPFISRLNIPVLLLVLQLLGGLGFYLLTLPGSVFNLYAGAFLIGLFYGNNAILVRITTSFLKTSSVNLNFALLSSVTNLASSGGAALLSFIFYHFSPKSMLYFLTAFMVLTSVLTAWSARQLRFPKQGHFLHTSLMMLKSDAIRLILLMVMLLWFCLAFFMTILPLYAIDRLHEPGISWLVTALNGLLVLLLSYPLNWALRHISEKLKVLASLAVYLGAFLLLAWDAKLLLFYALLLLMTGAEIIAVPAYQSLLTSQTADNERLAAFSLIIIAVGLGESLGSMVSVYVNHHPSLLAAVIGCVALLALGLALRLRSLQGRDPLS